MSCTRLFSLLLAGAFCAPALSASVWVPTNYGNGADAEVKEEDPFLNRGSSIEIASRISDKAAAGTPEDAGDRNALIYVRIDLTGYQMPDDGKTAFRMTYGNNNLVSSRIADYITPNSNFRTGMAYYGLSTSAPSWDESTINYATAPGINFPGDSNVGTRDLNLTTLKFLGTQTFEAIGTQNHLPIGGALDFVSPNLDKFVSDAIAAGKTEVTLVAHTLHDSSTFFKQFNNWINFNYIFNPKEQTTLKGDNYNAGDGLGNIGNKFGTDNSTGAFSPSLLLKASVPEPTSAVLGALAVAAMTGIRRRG